MTESGTSADAAAQKINLQDNSSLLQMPESIADADAEKVKLENESSSLQMSESGAAAQTNLLQQILDLFKVDQQKKRDNEEKIRQEKIEDKKRMRLEKQNEEKRFREEKENEEKKFKEEKQNEENRLKLKERRSIKRRHLVDTAGSLAIVAALIGGGVLEVLLSPAWAQIAAENAVGSCQDRGNCEMWRSWFVITASTAFCLDIIVLLLTFGGEFSVKGCLFINFSSNTVYVV